MEYLRILTVLVLCVLSEHCMEDKEPCSSRNVRIPQTDQCSYGNYPIKSFSSRNRENAEIDSINQTSLNVEKRSRRTRLIAGQRWQSHVPTAPNRVFLSPILSDAVTTFLSKKQNCCNQDEQFLNHRMHKMPPVIPQNARRLESNAVSSQTHQGAESPRLSQLKTGHHFIKHPSISPEVSHSPIQRSLMGRIPFCNVAHLRSSVSCSGMVITSHHILTAAHCVHGGYHFDRRLRKMRISVPSSHGFEHRRVQSVHVPRRWLNNGDRRTDSERAVYDFAVIELDSDLNSTPDCPRNGTRGTMASQTTGYNDHQHYRAGIRSRLGFASFPANGEHRMWQTTCSTLDQSSTLVRHGLLPTSCPSLAGSSGAAVFVQSSAMSSSPSLMSSSMRDLIGFVSHEAKVSNNRSYMVITVLNQSKRRLICAMTGSSVHNFCSDTMPNKHRFVSYSLHRTQLKLA